MLVIETEVNAQAWFRYWHVRGSLNVIHIHSSEHRR